MEIELLTTENEKEWNEFCLKSNSAWFRHTTYWQKYVMDCREDTDSKNYSFLIRHNKKIVAIVPLISQYVYGNKELSEFANYDTPVPLMAIKNDDEEISRDKVFELAQNHIDELAKQNKINQGHFFVDPLINKDVNKNFDEFNLLKNDYFPELKTTTILDMTLGEDAVLRQMRKGHKSDIKSAFRDRVIGDKEQWEVKIFDKDNVKSYDESVSIMREIHFIDSGRRTRTELSWKDMYEWILAGFGFLVLLKDNTTKKDVAAGFFINYKNKVYYASYATIDSHLLNGKIGYIIQWSAMKYMLSHSITDYETGWNYYLANFDKKPDEKIMQISSFKRGFGGKEYLLLSFRKQY